MSSSLRACVNQRLYFCELQLQSLDNPPDGVVSERAYTEALKESVVYHLLTTYQVYLQEIAYTHCQIELEVETAAELKDKLTAEGTSLGEVNQLVNLETATTWLSALQGAFNSRKRKKFSSSRMGAEIQFVSINTEEKELTTEQIKEAFLSLRALVDSHRANMDEC